MTDKEKQRHAKMVAVSQRQVDQDMLVLGRFWNRMLKSEFQSQMPEVYEETPYGASTPSNKINCPITK